MAKTMWMVHAGEGGYLFDDFQKNQYVAIGWNEIGDIKDVKTIEQVRDRYNRDYPGEKPAKVNNAVAMIFKFLVALKEGQKVITEVLQSVN
jgi:restriction system protein